MSTREKYALVTGASSGIGRSTALRLVRDGFRVFATVRRAPDGEALAKAAPDGLTPLIMDVRAAEQIADAAAHVAAQVGDHGLDLLVNNAGIGVFQPLELLPLAKFRFQWEVNVEGQLAVTQVFLPLLRAAAGRIVMIGSIADRITMPFAGSLAAAKCAIFAMTEALRQELAPWGIRVVLIEPASIRTDAIDKFERDAETALDEFGTRGRELYGDAFLGMTKRALAQEQAGSHPDEVAAVVSRAVASPKPKARYLAGKHSLLLATVAKLPPTVLDGLRRRLFRLPEPGSLAGSRTDTSTS